MTRNLVFGSFRLDLDTDTLFGDAGRIMLGTRGSALLRVLLEAQGAVVSKAALMDAAWPGIAVEESNLTVQVAALRRTIGDNWIATVSRRGYRFVGTVTESRAMDPHDTPATLAVLPVSNAGCDEREQYFGDGVVREVITALSRFAGLTVIAANSSFQFRSDSLELDRVRRELGVRYLASSGYSARVNAFVYPPSWSMPTAAHCVGRNATIARLRTSSQCRTRWPSKSPRFLWRMSRVPNGNASRASRSRRCRPMTTTFGRLTSRACGIAPRH